MNKAEKEYDIYSRASNVSNPHILLEHVFDAKQSRVFNDMSVSFVCTSRTVTTVTLFCVYNLTPS